MKKLLYIKANPMDEKDSFGLRSGEYFIEEYKKQNPEDEIIELDLFEEDIPNLDKILINYSYGKINISELSEEYKAKVLIMDKYLKQFMECDKYVFVTPLWNLGLPPILKSYIDVIAIVGKTFKYTEKGPVGLLENKKGLNIHACGGIYTNSDASVFEHGYRYLKDILNFLGVIDYQNVIIEGTNIITIDKEQIEKKVKEELSLIAKKY